MQARNWIEIGILALIIIVGLIFKRIVKKKIKHAEGFKGINKSSEGRGWKPH